MLVVMDFGDPNKGDSLPWYNEYDPTIRETHSSKIIQISAKSPKGLLVQTTDYKAFLYSGSNIAKYMSEALDFWASSPERTSPGLYGIWTENKSFTFAQDKNEIISWTKDKKSKLFVPKWSVEEVSDLPSTNPFLLSSPYVPHTTSAGNSTTGKKKSSTASNEQTNSQT